MSNEESSLPPILEMRGVTVMEPALVEPLQIEGVNWRVNGGDFWVVAGPLGAGKSALLMTACALRRPKQGEVRLFGWDTAAMQGEDALVERLRVGIVFGGGGRMFHELTVKENVHLPLRYHRNLDRDEVTEEVEQVLRWAGVSELARAKAGSLNRVWQQRVALARAMVLKPDLLFLDDPLAGMDPRHGHWWLQVLEELSRGTALEGRGPMTLVSTAEYLRPWLAEGRRFALIKEKHFRVIGSAEEIARDKDPLVRELLAETDNP